MAKNVVINGVTYNDVPEVDIPLAAGGGTAKFYDTSGAADLSASDILTGKTAYGPNGAISGSMPNVGGAGGTIALKAQEVTIAEGYHDGTGKVSIDSTEQGNIISDNIKSGATILGVTGKPSVVDTADATATQAQILSGATAYVNGQKLTGSMTAATVSQDSTTKVLSIS